MTRSAAADSTSLPEMGLKMTIPRPGSLRGACAGECDHAWCEQWRRIASTPCSGCQKLISHDAPIDLVRGQYYRLEAVHSACWRKTLGALPI